MNRIEMRNLVGNSCITSEDGQRMYDRIHPPLDAGESVVLDFTGVDVIASPFFNAAVGQLLRDLPSDWLNTSLDIVGLHEDGMAVLRRIVENAKTYYADLEARRAQDHILDDQAEQG